MDYIILPLTKYGFAEAKYQFRTAINWSALSGIGNSKAARLTILMPMVGYLIIFNTTVSSFLQVSLPVGDLAGETDGFISYLYSKNMKFLYFGLLVFGLGVGLYNIFVPRQIKEYPSVENYIKAMEDIRTDNMVIGSFDNIIGMYHSNLTGEERSSFYSSMNSGFPRNVSADTHRLIESMYFELKVEDWSMEDGKGDDPDRKMTRFFNGSGQLMTEEVINVMYSGRRVERGLLLSMYEVVSRKSKDVFYIEHKALEYSGTNIRLVIFIFYALGLMLTALPSLTTSIMIFKQW